MSPKLVETITLLLRLAKVEGVVVLTLFVVANLNAAAREEFLRVLREQVARAQGRARFAALRELEEQRIVNEKLAQELSELERVILLLMEDQAKVEELLSPLEATLRELLTDVPPVEGSLLV